MKRPLSLILLCICIIFSCKKYGDGYVKGTVTQKVSNLPLPGVSVFLRESKKHQKDGAASTGSTVDTAVTDKDGNYLIEYHKQSGYTYYMYLVPRGILGQGNFWERNADLNKKMEKHNFEIDPIAYLQIHLKKTTVSGKRVELSFDDGIVKLPENPNPFDTILPPIKVYGNFKIEKFKWNLIDKDPKVFWISHPDTLYINGGDTLVYPITYP